ncbi:glutathione S-transferase [Pseudomonas tohonis]|nr:hypothetical protein L682_29215 [Pseudomonas alcaligenes OT 69]MDN4149322.1 glutathione S-transferase [Pseudomonas tohonis]
MKLIGMLDSPYVRRVAISLHLLDIPFEHEAVSVFRHFDAFKAINPVVKAPTLVLDDGTALMDSSLILDYLETLAGRSLLPAAAAPRAQALRVVGLALALCEKAVQIVYEKELRPQEKQHAPWLERVRYQLHAACRELEAELARRPLAEGREMGQDGISLAVAWGFARLVIADELEPAGYPLLANFAERAERLPAFVATPMT